MSFQPRPCVYLFSLETFSSENTLTWKCLLSGAYFSSFSEFLTEQQESQNLLFHPSHFIGRNWGPGREGQFVKSPAVHVSSSILQQCLLGRALAHFQGSIFSQFFSPLTWGDRPHFLKESFEVFFFFFEVSPDPWARREARKFTWTATMLWNSLPQGWL